MKKCTCVRIGDCRRTATSRPKGCQLTDAEYAMLVHTEDLINMEIAVVEVLPNGREVVHKL